jgi:hypothetical protein
MEDIFEEIHNDFINSEEFDSFMKEFIEYSQSQSDVGNIYFYEKEN